MGSGYFGEMNLGNDKATSGSSSSSSSSRKSKKNNSDKPKQPQRGLGVAQLEKIRLHGQMGCNYHPSLPYHNPTNFIQEDLRVQSPYSSSIPSSSFSYSSPSVTAASHGYNQGLMMGLGDYERANIRYDDAQQTYAPSWSHGNGFMDIQQYGQPTGMTRHFLNLQVEDSQDKKNKKHRGGSSGSSSQNSEPNDTQDVDLELRLSL